MIKSQKPPYWIRLKNAIGKFYKVIVLKSIANITLSKVNFLLFTFDHRCTQRRGKGGEKFFAKLVNKNAIKHQKRFTLPQILFTTSIYPPSQNLAKTS